MLVQMFTVLHDPSQIFYFHVTRFPLAARGPRHGAVRSGRDPGRLSRHLYRGQTQEQASIFVIIWTV